MSFKGFVSHSSELWSIFGAHDLLCVPSYTEGVPRVIVEAMARGLPVASTLVGGITNLFSGNVYPIKSNTPESVFEAIDFCFMNSSLLSSKILENLELSRQFTIESTVDFVDLKFSTEELL